MKDPQRQVSKFPGSWIHEEAFADTTEDLGWQQTAIESLGLSYPQLFARIRTHGLPSARDAPASLPGVESVCPSGTTLQGPVQQIVDGWKGV